MLGWNDVQYFLAVQRAGTLAGAARELRVEHTTVGRRVTAMESALHAKLFVRTPEGFRLTPLGEEILPLAERAEAAILTLERLAMADDERAEGTVRVTTSDSFVPIIGRWLVELRAKHPRITVELHTGNANLDLARREADLAVRFAPTTQGALVSRRVVTIHWAPYAARSYVDARGGLPPSGSLAGHDVIGFDDTLAQTPGATWLRDHAVDANLVLKSGSLRGALNAAMGGLGVAVLPCFMASAEPTLVRLLPTSAGSREGYLIVHPDLARVARVRVVLNFLIERFAENAEQLGGGTQTRVPAEAHAAVPRARS